MSDSSNDFGDLSLSCSVSSAESEESKVSDDLETVEPYQFEPIACDSSAESDTVARQLWSQKKTPPQKLRGGSSSQKVERPN